MNHQKLLLDYIRDHWRQHRSEQLDRGVWVALHSEITETEEYKPSTPVVKAWFITDRNIAKCAPISFKLFVDNKLKVKVNESHEMGEANIAPYPTSGVYYIDFIIAPLWGVGTKISIERGEVVERCRLWIS